MTTIEAENPPPRRYAWPVRVLQAAQRPQLGGRLPEELDAWLHIGKDGIATAYIGKVEVGQGSRTELTQAVAEELHLPPASVRCVRRATGSS